MANAAITKLLFFHGWLTGRVRTRKKKVVYGITLVTGCAIAMYLSHDLICDSIHDSVMTFLLYRKLWSWKEYEGGFPAFAVVIRRRPPEELCNLFPGFCGLAFAVITILTSIATIVIVTKMFLTVYRMPP
ncbi:hypothetical protein Pint_35088 [Pistacia integerrima]|uniref:Uncharacterized protein n=1 Tax=Pistacia integerrima TaxID=434235 RepID=A0ACC0XZQ4_9ROSI|nr:hypothetical protein Pint_35088 [Pistacia integerrima]